VVYHRNGTESTDGISQKWNYLRTDGLS